MKTVNDIIENFKTELSNQAVVDALREIRDELAAQRKLVEAKSVVAVEGKSAHTAPSWKKGF